MKISPPRLRNFAALLTTLSGVCQSAALWFLPTTPQLLMTSLCGAVYLLLALGLFGVSRFSLFLGVLLPLLRVWFGAWPLPIEVWEISRGTVDVAIALSCVIPVWSSLHPDFEPGRPRSHAHSEEASDA